jgi:hypothetical protein
MIRRILLIAIAVITILTSIGSASARAAQIKYSQGRQQSQQDLYSQNGQLTVVGKSDNSYPPQEQTEKFSPQKSESSNQVDYQKQNSDRDTQYTQSAREYRQELQNESKDF